MLVLTNMMPLWHFLVSVVSIFSLGKASDHQDATVLWRLKDDLRCCDGYFVSQIKLLREVFS